jgi:hypothetical protein
VPVRLRVVPCTRDQARAYVLENHRHNDPPVGAKYSVAVADEVGAWHGVAMVGRPVAREADDGWTLEVLRVATDGARNACSMLYGAAARIAWDMGYRRIITYTQADEPGTSLRAAGWDRDEDLAERKSWTHTSGPRKLDQPTLFFEPKHPIGPKVRWVKVKAAA